MMSRALWTRSRLNNKPLVRSSRTPRIPGTVRDYAEVVVAALMAVAVDVVVLVKLAHSEGDFGPERERIGEESRG